MTTSEVSTACRGSGAAPWGSQASSQELGRRRQGVPGARHQAPLEGAAEVLPRRLDEGLVGTLQDALGADVDPRTGGHLAEHRQAHRFETAELVMPRIVKSDNTRQPFDESKLRSSMSRALEKRPVPSNLLEQAIGRLIHKLRTMGEREVPTQWIGGKMMEGLAKLDEVAYVRFASVYRQFKDINEFMDELKGLLDTRKDQSA